MGFRRELSLGSIPACAGEPVRQRAVEVNNKVYPRVCGGTMPAPTGPVTNEGLSPRVRGNQPGHAGGDGDVRSIPACAGEPHRQIYSRDTDGVYPRVCGGTIQATADTDIEAGLSPRVRGNRGLRF